MVLASVTMVTSQDTDVQDERKKVISGAITEQDVVVIKNLVKVRE